MLRSFLLVIALAAPGLAGSQDLEPLEGIARLSHVEGKVNFQTGREAPTSTPPDRPLVSGDRLTTGPGGRVELGLGIATLRASERTALTLADLGTEAVRVELDAGAASLLLHEMLEGETFAIATPTTTIAFLTAGDYRVDVFVDGTTELTVRTGAAEMTTEGGPVRVADGQRARLEARAAQANLLAPQPADDFDEWVLEREVKLAEAAPPPYESMAGYDEQTVSYYRAWYDDPGYASNYGYWSYLDYQDRWCWVPRRRHRHHDNDNDNHGPRLNPPRRLGADGQSVFHRSTQNRKQSQGGSAPVSGDAPTQGSSGNQNPPPRTTPTPAPAPTPRQNPPSSPSSSPMIRPSRPDPAPKGSPPPQPQ